MRLLIPCLGAVVLLAHLGIYSCDSDDHGFEVVEDVTVDVTGTAGVDFDARFEDDDHSQSVTGVVPFSSDFNDQINFFHAVVDKNSSGSGQVCVKVTSSHNSRQECSTDPNARVSVTLFF
ncbi:MAG TPA: hypothetical protein VFE84_01445 [Patescibacteria group bacterium]|nr:hypothetical protein [Patescibacteria group bacterium]